jgi:23S rRNA (guanosine2251-2'-O)-methyltransferase
MPTEMIYGRNPVYETLRAGRRRLHGIQLARGVRIQGRLKDVMALASQAGLPQEEVGRAELDKLGVNHQGVLLETGSYPYVDLPEILVRATAAEPPFVLLLDEIQDPQNLAALMRTGEAAGVHGVVIPGHRSAAITPAVVNASSGASEHLLVARMNLVKALDVLKENDVWITGLEASPDARPLHVADLGGAMGLVIGSEGEGMRRLVREACDFLVRLPMRGQIQSLNAAAAGAVAIYAIWAARGYPGIDAPLNS